MEQKQVIRNKVHIVMNNYKESRELKNLTVEEVSEKLSISKTAIYNIEKGENSPSVDNLVRLAKLYEVSTDYILGNTRFKNFSEQYDYLQSLDDNDLFKELNVLHINEFTTKDWKTYSKLNGEWFLTIR